MSVAGIWMKPIFMKAIICVLGMAIFVGCSDRDEVEVDEMGKTRAPFGSWESPVDAGKVSRAAVGRSDLRSDNGMLYWLEFRPNEGGRSVVVERAADGSERDITPEGFNVRTRVHEYGGGAWIIRDGVIFFSDFTDQRLYRQPVDGEPEALTPENIDLRYADCDVDVTRNQLICVREDHRQEGEPQNTIIAIDLDEPGEGKILFSGSDFVSAPRVSPDGARLVWMSWDHPNMPWDVTTLHLAELGTEGLSNAETLSQPVPGSVTQPSWAPDSELYFVADWTDWWNIYRWEAGHGKSVSEMEAEFAAPDWNFGNRNILFLSATEAVVSYTSQGQWMLGRLDIATGKLTTIGESYAGVSDLTLLNEDVHFLRTTATETTGVYSLTPDNEINAVRPGDDTGLDEGEISRPRAITFPTTGNEVAHGFYYPPINANFSGPEGALPPLFVKVHGGPTAAASASFSYKTQYWTSRGFAVLDLNYRGSTGFGRTYRHALNGMWGISDVDDAIAGARYLAERGEVDGTKMTISGGSAGGFTVLSALAFHDDFNAGANYYGVSDLEALALETHKFESRYLDQLIGPYPEDISTYKERSPINAIGEIKSPLIVLQGTEDRVVPQRQSEMVVNALRSNNIPVAYLPFEGEQHGFRRAENIERALEAELFFYGRVFGFEPSGDIEPVEIENEDALKNP